MNPSTSQNHLPGSVQRNHQQVCSSFELTNAATNVSSSSDSAKVAMFNLVFLVTISVLFIGIIPGGGLLLFEHINQHANDTNRVEWREDSATDTRGRTKKTNRLSHHHQGFEIEDQCYYSINALLVLSSTVAANAVDRRFGPASESSKGGHSFNKKELSAKFNGKVNICEVCKCLEYESTIVRCPFKRLDRKTLANLDFPDEMHSLDLRFYGIRKTEPSMFNQLSHKNISEVHLGRNKIGRLQSGTLQGLETVRNEKPTKHFRFLDVTSARLGAIESHVFDGLHEMESLWLDENHIGLLPKSIFCGLEHLKELNLNANRIRTIIPGTFQNLKNLEYLYMDSNRVQHIAPSTFYGLTKLKYLGLSKNYLKTLDKGAFGQLMNIDYLDLSQNAKLEDSLTKRVSPTCRSWQTEYLACEPYTQYTIEHPKLFQNESIVAVHDDMLCEPVDELVNFESGPCSESTDEVLCCSGKSHLKQIFALPEYYWRDSCCGEQGYSRIVFLDVEAGIN